MRYLSPLFPVSGIGINEGIMGVRVEEYMGSKPDRMLRGTLASVHKRCLQGLWKRMPTGKEESPFVYTYPYAGGFYRINMRGDILCRYTEVPDAQL